MRSYALAPLLGFALCVLASGCDSGGGDYSAVVTWAINGMLPNPQLCAEQGISRGVFEVRTESGKLVQTLSTDCSATVVAPSDGIEFGGFETSRAFRFDVPYRYTITLVDQNGQRRADAISGPLNDYGDDPVETPTIDYFQPAGNVAGLYGEWSIGNAATIANAASCGDITTVTLLVNTITDADFQNTIEFLDAPCADGKIESQGKALATGVYNFRYEALGARGNSVQIGDPIEVTVDGSGDVLLPRMNFLGSSAPTGPTMQNR